MDQSLLRDYSVYHCQLLDPGLHGQDFIFATDEALSDFWVLTEDSKTLSTLYGRQSANLKARDADVLRVAIVACQLTRPYYKYFVPLIKEKQFSDVVDRAHTDVKFRPFAVEKLGDDHYAVSGLFLIGSSVTSRRVEITKAGIKFTDKVLDSKAGTAKGFND